VIGAVGTHTLVSKHPTANERGKHDSGCEDHSAVYRHDLRSMFAAAGTVFAATGFDGPAPFGLAWGPLKKIPRPSLALKDVNVTVLLYRRDRLPSPELPDTEVILLDVCKKEGLQQISWASRPLFDRRGGFQIHPSPGRRWSEVRRK
jgi:hypothetical protein